MEPTTQIQSLSRKICPTCGAQVMVLIYEYLDGQVVRRFCHHCATPHCLRSDGKTERAWFNNPEEAAAFRDQHPDYFGDAIVFCQRCGLFHCSNPNWMVERPWEVRVEDLKRN